ncbi:hypothetical protein B0H16DRAFT_1474101 [Mycena metata]|uniref:Uncharacterized protein n=1 Tax=Mycena metata TaxID=1033252 RepID=A0AAD7HHN6_9AGAR|nr:hypothetical protein B0H16DRAFT_1474101 [Mycena metata]
MSPPIGVGLGPTTDRAPAVAEKNRRTHSFPGPGRIHTTESFLQMGLQIQFEQFLLAHNLNKDPGSSTYLKLENAQIDLKERIQAFRAIQQRFMPHLELCLTPAQRRDLENEDYFGVPAMRLYLPSGIADPQQRLESCPPGLVKLEAELRDIEVRNAQYHIDLANIKRKLAIHGLKRVGHRDVKVRNREHKALRNARLKAKLWTSRVEYAEAAAQRLRAYSTLGVV